MSESNSAVLEAPVIETAEPKAPAKPRKAKVAKKPAAKKASKASKKKSTAPKSKPMPDGKSVHATEPKREPKWNPRRIALVKAMRTLGAVDAESARSPEDIAKKMGTVDGIKMAERVDLVKVILDVYRTSELIHNGFAKSCKVEGVRGNCYYLTAKGQSTPMTNKE
jgi:hypothetical protein